MFFENFFWKLFVEICFWKLCFEHFLKTFFWKLVFWKLFLETFWRGTYFSTGWGNSRRFGGTRGAPPPQPNADRNVNSDDSQTNAAQANAATASTAILNAATTSTANPGKGKRAAKVDKAKPKQPKASPEDDLDERRLSSKRPRAD